MESGRISGFVAGRKVKGRKWHIRHLLFPWLWRIFIGSGYASGKFRAIMANG
ncbi:hypothetical protein GGR01_003168 [Acetobacter oeni]|nr:hypothetical protein [Acetobacter oeni]NHO20250.1 hypothetical protein [Acetobacter oeni]